MKTAGLWLSLAWLVGILTCTALAQAARPQSASDEDGASSRSGFLAGLPALQPSRGSEPVRTSPSAVSNQTGRHVAPSNKPSWVEREWNKLEPEEKTNMRYLAFAVGGMLLAIAGAYIFLSGGSWD